MVRFWLIVGALRRDRARALLRRMDAQAIDGRASVEARRRGPAAPSASRARASRARPPRGCSPPRRARHGRRRADGEALRAKSPLPGVAVRLGDGDTLPDGTRARRHLAGLAAGRARCSPPRPRPASRSSARSSSPGGCAGPGAAPVAGDHRHRRQDHRRAHAGLHARRRRAPHDRRRQRRHADRRGRGRRRHRPREPYDVLAVELSSFQLHWSASVRPVRRDRAQRRARPPRLARLAGGVRRRQGQDLRAGHPRRRQRGRRVVQPRAGRTRRSLACGFTLGSPARRAARRRRGPAGRPGVHRRPGARGGRAGRADRRPAVRAAQRRQRARRGGAGPRVRRAGRGRTRRACARSRPTRTASS